MTSFGIKRIRARLICGVGVLALGAGAALAQTEDYSLPAQPLTDSLKAVARQSGQNILFLPQQTAGLGAPALNGQMSETAAVQYLLQGTNLEADSDGGSGLILRPSTANKQGAISRPVSLQLALLSTGSQQDLVAQQAPPQTVVAQNAPAQAEAASAEDNNVETVEVSASRISIAGYTAPTPVSVVDSTQLQQAANIDLGATLSQLPSMGNGLSAQQGSNGNASNSGALGISAVNLRNLGIGRDLVLFDGQRVVDAVFTGGVDLTTIPSNLVQRVDIVTGGASAAWGSDAVSGVVNVILDKSFTGIKGSIDGMDGGWDALHSYGGTITFGSDFDGGRGHFILAGTYNDSPNTLYLGKAPWWNSTALFNNPAYSTANPTAAPEYIPISNAGSCAVPGGAIVSGKLAGIQFGPGGAVEPYTIAPYGSGSTCAGGSSNNANSGHMDAMLTTPMLQEVGFAYGSYKVTPDITASLMLNYALNHVESSSETILSQGTSASSPTINVNNPYLPASLKSTMMADNVTSFYVASNYLDGLNLQDPNFNDFYNTVGQPVAITTRQLYRGVFKLDGALGSDWSWDVAVQHSESHLHQVDTHIEIPANLANAVNAVTVTSANVGSSGLPIGSIQCASTLTNPGNGCVPYDVLGTGVQNQAAVNYINYNNDWFFSTLEQDTLDASMQGKLPWDVTGAGAPAVAFGFDYRKEAAVDTSNALATNIQLGGGNFQPLRGEYNVEEGFAEIDAPLLKNTFVEDFNFNAAGRMTSYSTFGLVETWKLGLTSQINDDIRLRATWSYDIRAPNLGELFGSVPASGTYVLPSGSTISTAFAVASSNPNLEPEKADTWEVGTVLTPHWVDGLTMSFDWYSIVLHGYISTPSESLTEQLCAAGNQTFCAYFVPNTTAPTKILDVPQNAGYLTTSGLDFNADYAFNLFTGAMALHLSGNYTDEETLQSFTAPAYDYAGSMSNNSEYSGVPKVHILASATYTDGPWMGAVQTRFIGAGNLNNAWNFSGPCQTVGGVSEGYCVANNNVSAIAYLDLRAAYNWSQNLQFYLSVDNVLDTPPPLVTQTASLTTTDSLGTDITQYDTLGRLWHAGIRFNF